MLLLDLKELDGVVAAELQWIDAFFTLETVRLQRQSKSGQSGKTHVKGEKR